MTTPTAEGSESSPERLHHLDALRAGAMLLGIVLHAALAYSSGSVGVVWIVNDEPQPALGLAVAFIHGFRMQLFFLMSGFFTAMLWRRRGLAALLRHRGARIVLPLLLGLVTIVPLTWGAIVWAGAVGANLPDTGAVGPVDPDLASATAATTVASTPADPPTGAQVARWLLFRFPFFHHLWFLWFLCWMVAGFAVVAAVLPQRPVRRVLERVQPSPRIVRGLVTSPFAFVWLLPMTIVTIAAMDAERGAPGFGPDTSIGLLPLPGVLLHYSVFFAAGSAVYLVPDGLARLSRHWSAALVLAVVAFPFGVGFALGAPWTTAAVADPTLHRLLGWTAQACFAWFASIGLVGLLARLMPREIPSVRYLSDSAYWLYLAHLPLVVAGQILLRGVGWPPMMKWAVLVAGSTAILLASYEWMVRGTWIGRLLNGERKPPRHAVR